MLRVVNNSNLAAARQLCADYWGGTWKPCKYLAKAMGTMSQAREPRNVQLLFDFCALSVALNWLNFRKAEAMAKANGKW